MSDNATSNPIEASNELVRWFQLLVLPIWARIGLLLLMGLIISSGVALLGIGIYRSQKDDIAAAMTLLTVALPVLLVVVAIVFGQQGDKRLRQLTSALLNMEIPVSLKSNIENGRCTLDVQAKLFGCRSDYELVFSNITSNIKVKLAFSVELNVRKVNIAFWLTGLDPAEKLTFDSPVLGHLRHVIAGAVAEGYTMNDLPAHFDGSSQGVAVVFTKNLDDQFLLRPSMRLYFCQDLAFFVRGVVEAAYCQQLAFIAANPGR